MSGERYRLTWASSYTTGLPLKNIAVKLCYGLVLISVNRMVSVRYLMFYLTDPSEFWMQLYLALNKGWFLWYCNSTLVPISKQQALRCKNGCFCYFYMENLLFIWFWYVFSSPGQKAMWAFGITWHLLSVNLSHFNLLLCNHLANWTKTW